MRRIAISRTFAIVAAAAAAAACSSPTFAPGGQLSANQVVPACVYCGGGGRSYVPPFLTDQAINVPQEQSVILQAH
ncbi:MAG TPA: hypothetical protein VF092_21925 [Longimicrobium sp.]